MTIADFIAKWRKAELKERSAAQTHFIDLCRIFDHPDPVTADPTGESFCFEKGAAKHGGGDGFADVWKRGHFGWEYKGKHKDLSAAYDQLLRYRDALESPPLLVMCDLDRIIVRTNFTGTVSAKHEIPLEALGQPRNIDIMRAVFHDPEALRPGRTSTAITQDAARQFADIAAILRDRGNEPATVAHFLDRIVFCLFAEDTGLLPEKVFTRILDKSGGDTSRLSRFLGQLFETMATGGDFGLETIRHFNGSLFDDPAVLDLTPDDVKRIRAAAALDWSAVDPSIFGTLFERGLDPAKRSQLGAHFTSREDIELVVDAVVMTPLRREWDDTRAVIENLLTTGRKRPVAGATAKAPTGPALKKVRSQASVILHNFLVEVQRVKVLDPACGSGNFLYMALLRLKDLEKEVILYGSDNDLGAYLPLVGPWQLYGIEINPYAHDLAQMTVWIGWLQWIRANGFGFPADPILRPLSDNIRLMDAIISSSGTVQSGTGNSGTGVPPVIPNSGTSKSGTGVPPVPPNTQIHALDPNKPVAIRQGGYLPHWTQDGATYAVCFRLCDALPVEVLRQWVLERDDIVKTARQANRELSDSEQERLAELHAEKVERWLDAGHGSCWLKDERVATLVRDALAHFDGERYDLLAWAVLPNHVHAIIRPRDGHRLPDIMHTWKSFTAKRANALLARDGEFWQAEYYDHLIRNEDDFRRQMTYILTNPTQAGLPDWPWVGTGKSGTGKSDTGESDRPWILDGANVHVSMVAFDDGTERTRILDGRQVQTINSNLTSCADITVARIIPENQGISFQGPSPKAPFDIDAEQAAEMLADTGNPNGRPNSDVVRPVMSAVDIGQGWRGKWTIDFGLRTYNEAIQYEKPFEYVKAHILPTRLTRRDDYRGMWWQYARPRPEMRQALEGKPRYIATPRISKHRLFMWLDASALANDGTIVFARDDDLFFGILHSRFHEVWALAQGTQLREKESGFRYTPTTCFETFPLPPGCGTGKSGTGDSGTGVPPVDSNIHHGQDAHATTCGTGVSPVISNRHGQDAHATQAPLAAIAEIARELDTKRNRWLNPDGMPAAKLKKRTLTNLYNERPAWLADCHARLDAAVATAYGWPADLPDEAILERLLALNHRMSDMSRFGGDICR